MSDLSLAYSPGVAEPCLEIKKEDDKIYDYTMKGNLVAVVSNAVHYSLFNNLPIFLLCYITLRFSLK